MVGVDEVGRGAWAGPLLVVAAQATLELPRGLTDSKLLSKKQRLELLNKLSNCCEFGEGWVTVSEIDQAGLANALRLGVERALKMLKAIYKDEIVMDGSINYVNPKFINSKCLVNGDLNIPIISAASIYAKVKRDEYMVEQSKLYPSYGFASHVGYGTKFHREMLKLHGDSPLHRQSYKPIQALLQ